MNVKEECQQVYKIKPFILTQTDLFNRIFLFLAVSTTPTSEILLTRFCYYFQRK